MATSVIEEAHHFRDGVGLADVREELVAEALPWLAPATKPAMSTNPTVAGTIFAGWSISASARRRSSGTGTMPTLGPDGGER